METILFISAAYLGMCLLIGVGCLLELIDRKLHFTDKIMKRIVR